MKKLLVLFLLLTLLSGCQHSELKNQAPVNAMYIDYSQNLYTVKLITQDIGEENENLSLPVRCYDAAAPTVQQAIVRAQAQASKRLFFRQCQILLLGQGIYEKAPFELCKQMHTSIANAPNVEVYGLYGNMNLTQAEKLIQAMSLFRSNCAKSYLYEFADAEKGILPLVCIGANKINFLGLAVYSKQADPFFLNGAAAEFCAGLLGKKQELIFVNNDNEDVLRYQITSPKTTYTVTQNSENPTLQIRLYGKIDYLLLSNATNLSDSRKKRKEISRSINRAAEDEIQNLIKLSLKQGVDLFDWRFYCSNACKSNDIQALDTKQLFEQFRIDVSAQFHIV